jgi:hypothetical protein
MCVSSRACRGDGRNGPPPMTNPILSQDDKDLALYYKELEKDEALRSDLNKVFHDLVGRRNSTEFSRCVMFFLLGRLFEKKFVTEGQKRE